MSLAGAYPRPDAGGKADLSQYAYLLEAGVAEVVICTPTGFVVIDLTGGTPPEEDPAAGSPGCKWCQSFAKYGLPAAMGLAVRLCLESGAAEFAVFGTADPASQWNSLGYLSRAPPSFSSLLHD